jgi:hypothetical protein
MIVRTSYRPNRQYDPSPTIALQVLALSATEGLQGSPPVSSIVVEPCPIFSAVANPINCADFLNQGGSWGRQRVWDDGEYKRCSLK